jgi:diguanylate cyclase (GGDEF)-like protein
VGILTYCAINFTSVLFCRALFKPYEPPPKLMRGLDLLLFTFPLLLAAVAMGYDSQAVNTNAALIKITWLYLVVVAFSLRVERTPSRRVLQIFFVSILMNNVVFWLANRDIQIVSRINLSAIRVLVVDGLIIGGLFAMILHTRSRQMQREGQQSVLDLALVQKKLEIEQDLKERAEIEAQTDYLTGLVNRRRFVELAKRELARSIRFKRPLTMLMIDIDLFKIVNDTWGHSVGDAVLKEVAKLIRGTLRDEDILGRTGGEEFAAVIVESEGNDAFEVARRVCTTVAHAVIAPPGAGNIQVTVSIGPAQLGMRVIDFDNLLNEADRAMYKAKQAGGNRVTVA